MAASAALLAPTATFGKHPVPAAGKNTFPASSDDNMPASIKAVAAAAAEIIGDSNRVQLSLTSNGTATMSSVFPPPTAVLVTSRHSSFASEHSKASSRMVPMKGVAKQARKNTAGKIFLAFLIILVKKQGPGFPVLKNLKICI